jgi:type II secretory pathway pseudopilin PulG
MATRPRRSAFTAFTLVEVMVVVAILAALIGILLPALSLVRKNADLVTSQSNMRSIGALMTSYSLDNRDHVVPSQFDYTAMSSRTTVRSPSPAGSQPNIGPLFRGSWADILWTVGQFGPIPPRSTDSLDVPNPAWDYRYDSPDYWAYTNPDMPSGNVFRSKVEMTKPLLDDDTGIARPFGNGASIAEAGQPGYFAANDFFDARPSGTNALGTWFTNAMIRHPAMSMYLVDSRAGETIPLPNATVAPNAWLAGNAQCEVDFRYVGDVCCMLYMDGHVTSQTKWINVADLLTNRQTRIERLDQRN